MENPLQIAVQNVNLEIMAKLLNSVARKYDCHVAYNTIENRLNFTGEEEIWKHIYEELVEHFLPESKTATARIRNRFEKR